MSRVFGVVRINRKSMFVAYPPYFFLADKQTRPRIRQTLKQS